MENTKDDTKDTKEVFPSKHEGQIGLPAVESSEYDDHSIHKRDLLSLEHTDPALNAKMNLINDAIDEIGFTPYHAKLFVLNGFG